jgi:hypothetical protein
LHFPNHPRTDPETDWIIWLLPAAAATFGLVKKGPSDDALRQSRNPAGGGGGAQYYNPTAANAKALSS